VGAVAGALLLTGCERPVGNDDIVGTWVRGEGVPAIAFFHEDGTLSFRRFGMRPGTWTLDGEQLCLSLERQAQDCGSMAMEGRGIGATLSFQRENGPPSVYRKIETRPDTLCWEFDAHGADVAVRSDDPACGGMR
jgi:hypothetical protein